MEPNHITPVLARASAAFRAQFGTAPTWGAAAPGRVNLIGEHTDYNGGFVLPIAIDRVCVAVGGPSARPGMSSVYSADLHERGQFDAREPIRIKSPDTDVASGIERGSWLGYVAGVFAQYQREPGAEDGVLPNLDIAIGSSVPVGSGLSSSAAIEVATATLLEPAIGVHLEPKAKALLCQRAEHEFAGVPCGIMDQFISVMGQKGHALLIDCRTQTAAPIPMPPSERAVIVVMDTGVRHSLAAGEYARRRATCAAAARNLEVRELRDANLSMLARANLPAEESRCARHVITEIARTLAAAEAFASSDLPTAGRLMLESHASLRDDYRVSSAELDTLVESACAVPGVYGARMTGGGFGGCAIALVEPGAAANLANSVGPAYRRAHGRECGIFVATAAAGAMPISV